MALIEDNRQMRDKLSNVRDQLESSRLQVLQLRNNLERAEEAGMRDVVTLIGNRRYFDTTFAEELERARKTGDDFCLALADLDRFKLVNDRFGHLVGDRILRLFAEILVQNVRGQDRVARFGGEEFALMLPGASLEDATTAVERIRKVLEAKQWTFGPTGERVGTITASFGLAQLRASETGSDLIKRVDDRLYDAKAKGRNCVVADTSESAPTARARAAPETGRERLTICAIRMAFDDPNGDAFRRALDEAARAPTAAARRERSARLTATRPERSASPSLPCVAAAARRAGSWRWNGRTNRSALRAPTRSQARLDSAPAQPTPPKPSRGELGFSAGLTAEALTERWRAFVWRNHPDRQPAHARERANARVAVANALYDRARRALRRA